MTCGKDDEDRPLSIVTYLGAPGEVNRVTATSTGATITLTDPGATVTVEAPCRSLDPHTAVCQGGGGAPVALSGFTARLGDGDDAFTSALAPALAVSLLGEGGDDVLNGGDGDDALDGGPGADRLAGGDGDDEVSFVGRTSGVVVNLSSRRTSDGDRLRDIEGARGGDGSDRMHGGPRAEYFLGGKGADTLRGGGGEDVLSGELGVDHVEGGGGDDMIIGDPAPDDPGFDPDIPFARDVLRGGPGDDLIADLGGRNLIDGGSGKDDIFGGDDRDRILGGPGTDWLAGGAGADDLRGGGADDTLDGGRGTDVLRGGAGRDRATTDRRDRVRGCEIVRRRGYTSPR